jgi:DNA repair protein RadC
MPLVKPEEFLATWDEWKELAPRENPRKRGRAPLFDTFDGLEVRVALVRAPDYKPKAQHVISCAADAYHLLLARFRHEPVESLVVLCLSARHRVEAIHVVARGNLTGVQVFPNHVFQAALVANASAIIVAHNHPSGDAEPSRDDLALTRRLAGAGELLGIKLLDHLIVGADSYVSLADRGAIPEMAGWTEARAAALGEE